MTRLERQAEYAYRYAERIGLMCGGLEPTLEQRESAHAEAVAACDKIDQQDKNDQEPLLI